METQRLSDYHTALHLVSQAVKDMDIPADALEQMEHHHKSMLDLLRELVDTGSLNMPSSIAIGELQELGLLDQSQSSSLHTQFLTILLQKLSQPTNAPTFFAEFNGVLPLIATHDRAATVLADQVRLFTLGLMDPDELTTAYNTFTEETKGITYGP